MSNALQIAQHLSRLGTDVFVLYSPECLFPTPKLKFYKSEAKHYVSDLDDFIGAEVEISVNIDEPLPFVIKNEESQEETSEVQINESPKGHCTEIPFVTKQNSLSETSADKDAIKYKSRTGDDRFPCIFRACFRNYSSKSNLLQHIREWHYKRKNFACDICDKKFARRSTLQNHQSVHTEVKPYGCNICEKRFKSQFKLKLHKLQYHGKNDNRCRSCNKKLPNQLELRFHELAHEGNQCFVCRTCNMRFILSFDLDQHECPFADIDIHTDRSKPPPNKKKQATDRVCCKICHKKLSRNYVKIHEEIYHFKVKLYTCHTCGKTFGTLFCLNQHVEYVHDGIKKHICAFCHKSFFRRADLNRHVKFVHEKYVKAGNDCATWNVNNNLQQG